MTSQMYHQIASQNCSDRSYPPLCLAVSVQWSLNHQTPYLAFLYETVDHAKDEARPEHMQQLQNHQKYVQEVVAEEGAQVDSGLEVSGIEDPVVGGREGEAGLYWLL